MKSDVVILGIKNIYDRLNIMPSLRMHMMRVAAVGERIISAEADYSEKIHKDDVIAALLLHDLGNIVKFRLGEELGYWKRIQQETVAKYGSVDHEVTQKMVHELEVNKRVVFLISEMGFENLHQVIDSNDIELKICLYADQRVAPYGIVSIRERFADLRKRYKDTSIEDRYSALQEERALLLEHQIFQTSSLHPQEINEQTIPYELENV